MRNLYVWFASPAERRAFVIKMLDIGEIVPGNQSKKAQKEAEEQKQNLKMYLDSLDDGKTKSFYYGLYKDYYMGRVPEPDLRALPMPWQGPAVYEKGFRQIYTQTMYEHRPGHWLVLDFRQSQAGRAMKQWVEARIPPEHIGTNVPIPEQTKAKWQLDHIQWLLDNPERALGSLDHLRAQLAAIQAEHPQLFAGDTVYLWERLAFLYFDQGCLDQAAFCLGQQAELQPHSTEAYLNWGSFYLAQGMFAKAVDAFCTGLTIDPQDEYLSFNLVEAYEALGQMKEARRRVNEAILKNPERGLNHKRKADLHRNQGEWEAALLHYEYAVQWMEGERWNAVKAECYEGMAAIHRTMGQDQLAFAAQQQAALLKPDPR